MGYDINCGVRLLATPLTVGEVRPRLNGLMDALYATIPSGVGASRSDVQLSPRDLNQVLRDGARWTVAPGYGREADLEAIETNGTLPEADPDCVSERAKERGKDQLGTVGSGHHFVEVGYVAERFDERVSDRLGLSPGTVTILIHSGSRGLGYQVCHDYLETMLNAAHKHAIKLPAKQLARSRNIPQELAALGVVLRAANSATVDEEMPEAYKDVAHVVDVVHRAGIDRKVAQLRPIGVVKG